MNFDKYIKYKEKYINLKNKNVMEGGGFFEDDNKNNNTKNKFMLCTLRLNIKQPSTLHSYLSNNIPKINPSVIKVKIPNLHMSLLQLEINSSHRLNLVNNDEFDPNNNFCYTTKNPHGKSFTSKFNTFLTKIKLKDKFIELFKDSEIETSKYDIIGRNNFFVQKLRINKTKVAEFKIYFFENLREYIKRIDPKNFQENFTPITVASGNYTLARYHRGEQPLYAMPAHYWGDCNFYAHVSLYELTQKIDISKISISNQLNFIFNNENIENITF